MDIKEKLIDIVAEYRDIEPSDVRTDVPFSRLGLDSLDVAELALKLEDEFGVTLDDALLGKLSTIDELTAHLTDRLAGRAH